MAVLLPEKLDRCRAQMGQNYCLVCTMPHSSELHVFAATCRRGCKTNTLNPLRKDIPNTFSGMTKESGKSAGDLFSGTEERMKNPITLGISSYVIRNSFFPYNERIGGRLFTEVWMLVDHLSFPDRSRWALYESQFPQLRSESHLAASLHTGGDHSVQMRSGFRGLSKVRVERYFIFGYREFGKPGFDSGQCVEC